jgi:hypothetical protein
MQEGLRRGAGRAKENLKIREKGGIGGRLTP